MRAAISFRSDSRTGNTVPSLELTAESPATASASSAGLASEQPASEAIETITHPSETTHDRMTSPYIGADEGASACVVPFHATTQEPLDFGRIALFPSYGRIPRRGQIMG